MSQEITVVTVRQVGGGRRWLALDEVDARAVQRDQTMLDAVTPLACLDVTPGGAATWEWPFGCENTRDGKAAIREARRRR